MIMNKSYVIVRTQSAGIHFGILVSRKGSEVVLSDTRRIWYWDGAASLSQLALHGVSRPMSCKFTVTLPEITLLGAIEIIPCSDAASKIILAVPEWKA
jgi:hypothetical protein